MSLKIVHDFQIKMYEILSNSNEIRQNIDKIYLNVMQDAKYPFLLIDLLSVKAKDYSACAIYKIIFDISVYARDKNQGILLTIADKVIKSLVSKNFVFESYKIIGMQASGVIFNRSQDLITTKLSINYESSIKVEQPYELS